MSGLMFERLRDWVSARSNHMYQARQREDQSRLAPAMAGTRAHLLTKGSRTALDGQNWSAAVKAPTNLEINLQAGLDSVPEARHRVVRWLGNNRVPGEIRDEIGLVVTELVTNAIEASPGPTARIEVDVGMVDHRIVLCVRDQGKGFPVAAPNSSPPSSSENRGRGLPIVNALMDGFDVRRTGEVTEVEVTRSLPDHVL